MSNPFEELAAQQQATHKLVQQLLAAQTAPVSVEAPETIYTKEQAATFLNISVKTLNNYIDRGTIASCKPEGVVYLLHSDLIAWLRQYRRATINEQTVAYNAGRA